jgi:hypothetical protein
MIIEPGREPLRAPDAPLLRNVMRLRRDPKARATTPSRVRRSRAFNSTTDAAGIRLNVGNTTNFIARIV